MTQAKTTKQPKEGLHTQNEKWEVHSTGSLPSEAEIHPANDPDGLIIIADVYKYEDAELIVKAVNERQALLNSYRELLEIVKRLDNWHHLEDGIFTYTDPNNDGDQLTIDLQTAINNANNI